MRTLGKLFGKSPIAPLQLHMERVVECVDQVTTLLEALLQGTLADIEQHARKISKLEHKADLMKDEIRGNLPRSLFMPIDRGYLLEILSVQDSIADKVEDIAILLTYKDLEIPETVIEPLTTFTEKNLEAFHAAHSVIAELGNLAESGFGGAEARDVADVIQHVAELEHEADVIQRDLLKTVYGLEKKMSMGDFFLLQKLIKAIGGISNLSENLADRVRIILVNT